MLKIDMAIFRTSDYDNHARLQAWSDYVTVGYIHVADVLVQHFQPKCSSSYCQTSDISRTLAGNKIVEDSDVVGDAPTKSSFST